MLFILIQLFSFSTFNISILEQRAFYKGEIEIIAKHLPSKYEDLKKYGNDTTLYFVYHKLSDSHVKLYCKKAFGIVVTIPDTVDDTDFTVTLLNKVENIYFWEEYKNLPQKDKRAFIRKASQCLLANSLGVKFKSLLKKFDPTNYAYASKEFKANYLPE